MSEVEFDEGMNGQELVQSRVLEEEYTMPYFAKFLVRLHLAKSEKQAMYILLAITCLCIIVAVIIYARQIVPPQVHPVYYEDISPETRQKLPPDILNSFPHKPATK